MTLSVIDDALAERVTAHLSQFGQLARPVLWTGKGTIVVHFTTDLNVTATDTRFAPLTLNWSSTFRATDGAVYFNVPAAWRKASREAGEGEANTMPMYLSLSDAQQQVIRDIAGGDVYTEQRQGTLKALVADGWISGTQEGGRILPPFALTPAGETMLFEYDVMRLHKPSAFKIGQAVQYLKWGVNGESHAFEWVNATVTNVGMVMLTLDYEDGTSGQRRANSIRVKPAIADPVTPIPANELENLDEPHADIGTLVSDEAPLTLPDAAIVNASEPLSEEYVYISLARPVWCGETVPSEGFVRSFEARHPVWSGAECAVYSRKLGRAELERYELRPYSYNAYEFTVGQRVLWLENDDVYEVTGRDDGRYHLRHECGDVQQYIPEIKLATAIERTAPVMTVTIEATGKEGVRLHPAPCGYPEYLCTCGLNDGDGQDEPPAPEQSADPIYQDYIGVPIRANDWVQTPAGLKGSIAGFTREHMAAVALMFESKSFDASTDIHDYLTHTLRKIDPPTPKDDPINYDAYNGGLADAALEALVQSDIERAEKVDPYAWATPAKRGALEALLARKHVYPQICEPSTTPDVWRMEDAWKVKTMQRTLDKIGGELVGRLEQDWNGDEPYCIALFKLEVDTRPDYEPYPSKRQTKPAADPNSIHAQYDALHAALPAATFLLIQLNGDEWRAYQMDAMLLRRYAPLCRFSPQTVNNAGEQWDKLEIPAGLIDETLTNATIEGGLTVALASVVRDEPGTLPVRDVTEIHRPGEPVQYIGKEAPPTEWDTKADAESVEPKSPMARVRSMIEPKYGQVKTVAVDVDGYSVEFADAVDSLTVAAIDEDTPLEFVRWTGNIVTFSMTAKAAAMIDQPQPEPALSVAPAAPSKLEMTPELQAAKIRLNIVGGLRLGLVESVTPMPYDGWFAVTFVHGATQEFTVPALRTVYEVGDVWRTKRTVYVRMPQVEPHGSAVEQAEAVLSTLPDLTAPFAAIAQTFAEAKAKADAFMRATEQVEPESAVELLSEADEAALIETLRLEHTDIAAESMGVTQFLLNVIARMRTTATVAAPY